MAPIGMKLKICSVTTGIALTISADVSQHLDSAVDSVAPQVVPQVATDDQIDTDTQINAVKPITILC